MNLIVMSIIRIVLRFFKSVFVTLLSVGGSIATQNTFFFITKLRMSLIALDFNELYLYPNIFSLD